MTRCIDAKGPIDILIKTIRSINKNSNITTGHSAYVYYDKLFEILNKTGRGLVLALDEIDAIRNQISCTCFHGPGKWGIYGMVHTSVSSVSPMTCATPALWILGGSLLLGPIGFYFPPIMP